jgi:hypothetical protein
MKFLLGSLISLLLAFSGALTQPSYSHADGCRNTGPKDRSLSLGSQVDGKIFTVCADQFATKKVAHKKRQSVKVTRVKPNAKVNPKGQVVFSYRKVGNSTRVSFKPVPPRAKRVTAGEIRVGQAVDFEIDRAIKLGASYVFGSRLGVRFTPIGAKVKFSDGSAFDSFKPSHRFRQEGTYTLTALVTYRVEYRRLVSGEYVNKKGARWVREPETIRLASNPVTVQIGNGATVVLVSN